MDWATVWDWFLAHGIKILIILAVGTIFWFVLRRILRPIIRRTMVRTKGESVKGVAKRHDTLVGILTGTGRVLIVLIVLLLILSELDIDIGPILAGFGIAGIAVGFGAQYLIRDLIAGVFIIMENQYRVGDVARIADIAGLSEQIPII